MCQELTLDVVNDPSTRSVLFVTWSPIRESTSGFQLTTISNRFWRHIFRCCGLVCLYRILLFWYVILFILDICRFSASLKRTSYLCSCLHLSCVGVIVVVVPRFRVVLMPLVGRSGVQRLNVGNDLFWR